MNPLLFPHSRDGCPRRWLDPKSLKRLRYRTPVHSFLELHTKSPVLMALVPGGALF